jgi:hypothetical protein
MSESKFVDQYGATWDRRWYEGEAQIKGLENCVIWLKWATFTPRPGWFSQDAEEDARFLQWFEENRP